MAGHTKREKEVTLEDFHIPFDRVFSVDASTSVQGALGIMDHYNVDQVLVSDSLGDDALVVTRRMVAAARVTHWEDTPVTALLESSKDPRQLLPASRSLSAAAEDLIEHDWVITTREGQPVGLATVGDALRAALA